jgi:hypothetical protein
VQELRLRGYDVDYVLAGGTATDVTRRHPRQIQQVGRLLEVSSIYCSSMWRLEYLVARSDLVLMGTFKGNRTIAELARRYGKLVGRFDHYIDLKHPLNVDFVAVAGPYFKELLLQWQPEVNPSDVFVVGSLRFDRAQWPEVRQQTREEFCRFYRCDPEKKIALYLTTSPDTMDDWYVEHFRKICDTVRSNLDFTLVIKPHPADYAKRRSYRFGGRHSWEILAPDATIVRPEHGYQSFRHCDVGISLASDVSHEFPLFRRPIVFVNSEGWPRQRRGTDGHPELKPYWPQSVPSWVGVGCKIEELGQVLSTGCYQVTDERRYQHHISRYCYKNDGLAYRRLADLVDTIMVTRLKETSLSSTAWLYAKSLTTRVSRRIRGIVRDSGRS